MNLPPLPKPAGFRTRYRSEPGMIGHYPWTYADQSRRRTPRPEHEDEDLFTAEQLRQAQREAVAAALPEKPRLTVRLTCFPESNGKTNWTALLVREDKWDGLIGNCGGISLARGELWNRVAWEAECARFLIGERDTEPYILDYGDDIRTPEEWKGEVDLKERMSKKAMLAAAPGGER